jgi:outer membrane receptor for ferrienterochelin and colicins
MYEGDEHMNASRSNRLARSIRLVLLSAPLSAVSAAVLAQTTPAPAPTAEMSEIQVLAKRVNARNRVDTPAPTLSYDEEFFQRFEPISVGDMMKRVPGVVFSDDIGEYAAPSLRGIGTEYTQVLINGRRVTGGTNDNTVVVDRIPSELVERIEIIRSPSADIDSQGIGGTLNIILKEGADLSGGVYRLGVYEIDNEVVPSAFLSYGNSGDRIDWNMSLNYQERFNRKLETDLERAFDGEGSAEPAFTSTTEGPDERETTDIAWTGDWRLKLGEGHEFNLGAFYMDTDRAETELGREFEVEDDDGELATDSTQANQLDAFQERNYGIFANYETPFGNDHSWEIELSYDETKFEARESNWEDGLDFDFASIGIDDTGDILPFLDQSNSDINAIFAAAPHTADELREDEFLDSIEDTDADDSELVLKSSVDLALGGSRLKLGLEGFDRQRDFSFRAFEIDDGLIEEDDAGLSLFDAKDQRANGYVKWTMDFNDATTLELGARGEFTSLDLDSTVSEALAEAADELATIGMNIVDGRIEVTEDSFEFNPSAHLRWDVSDRTQLRVSLARTVRRPSFDQLNPTLLIDDEESILGNPNLDQETAIGADAGFDVELGGTDAIFGFNAFYRDVSDKIELDGVPDGVNEIFQEFVDEDIEATVWINNPNKGQIWGFEIDLSTPLTFVSPNFHVFANYTYLDSEILDANENFPIEHRFSEQPDYVYNVGFDHLIESWGFTWGASYQQRGVAERWTTQSAETKLIRSIDYEGNLELFVEKTLANRFVVRLAAQNLLDARLLEIERAYESVEQIQDGTPVSARFLREEADPSVILTFRGTF